VKEEEEGSTSGYMARFVLLEFFKSLSLSLYFELGNLNLENRLTLEEEDC